MITRQVIDTLYKQYRKMPKNEAERNIRLIEEFASEHPALDIDGNTITLYNVDPDSPFSEINLDNVHACVDFESAIALVMHSSIFFISKTDGSVQVHVKEQPLGIVEMLRSFLEK